MEWRRGTDFVVTLVFVPFGNADGEGETGEIGFVLGKLARGGALTHEAFRPIGLTLIIPFLNSTKVPLDRRLFSNSQVHSILLSPLDGNIQIRDVVQTKVDDLLVVFFSDVFDERLCGELLAQPVCR